MKKVIGIIGVAGSGKTIVARHLVERYGFERTRFADPLKQMLRIGLGLTTEQIDGDLKMQPLPDCGGCTTRHLMQTLGTDWGRRMVHSDLWVNRWRQLVDASPSKLITVDDVRFPNEAAAVQAVGGTLWRVYRPGLTVSQHASERQQAQIAEDVLINNATTIADMLRSVDVTLASNPGMVA